MQRNWEETLQEFESSGLTVAKFCALHGLAKPTFYYWKKKLNEASPSSFLQIRTEGGASSSALTEILYPNGVKLRFNGRLTVSDLKALVGV